MARIFFPVREAAGLYHAEAAALPLAAAAAHLAAPNSSPALGPRLGVLGVAIGEASAAMRSDLPLGGGMVEMERVTTRGFSHSTRRMGVLEHDRTRIYHHT